MLVNVYAPSVDIHFSLDVGSDLTLEDFKIMCSPECSINPKDMKIFLNSQHLADDKKTLKAYNIATHDMLLIQQGVPSSSLPNLFPSGPTPAKLPNLDFSSIKVPGTSSQHTAPPPPTRASPQLDLQNPHTLREFLMNNPHDLALLKERNPAFAESIENGDFTKITEQLQKIREANEKDAQEKIRLLNSDPMDLEVQQKIAEEIERKNIEENMNMAIEEAPESFGQVVMLWINLKVNGHYVKAFVDTGAQMTIMSKNCAQRCNIMRLVDKRWAGIAKGVGTQKILGRIHMAQIQIENVFLQCSFSVLENQPMDVLLGLDMLRRHICVIDLRESTLTIGTTKTQTKFLSENELPSHGRLHDPNNPEQSQEASTSNGNEEEEIQKALMESAAEAMKPETSNLNLVHSSGEPPHEQPGPQNNFSPAVFNDKVRQLLDMGFKRSQAETELSRVNGDLQQAISNLLSRAANK
uniref:Protein DDI1 homolog 2-like n=1 Tax=Phallusia mammillata TaxID=59560 RepID=A0A6F9DB80_9ASCI|nr:protein DDI1 homolog 2-like [Phallusia mammillata]